MHSLYNRVAGQSAERFAALSDGIFAAAMTLLVLPKKKGRGFLKGFVEGHGFSRAVRRLILGTGLQPPNRTQ